MVRYISSRNVNDAVSSHEAVIRGLAKDGGLYTPEKLDFQIDPKDLIGLSYKDTAAVILSALMDDYSREEILSCTAGAYDEKFDVTEIVPVTKTERGWLMELWHGPTSAFKDIALTILPRLLTAAYQKENRDDKVAILTATSGDTGKAALSGFADVDHTAITVFYPEIGVSAIQKRQMATSKGNNVEVIAVRGNFDDCQRMVKEAVSDPEVLAACQGVTISSANSINAGRLIPQVVYYYSSYVKLVENGTIQCGDEVNFVVPTGNFGDILAGYIAKQIGLPVKRLICASNTNNVLTDFINTGVYSLDRKFHTTMSPSMDILISSNLERLLFMVSGNNDTLVAGMMKDLKEKGCYKVPDNMMQKIRETFTGYWTSEEECAAVIKDMFEKENILIDTHTAVGQAAMYKYQDETKDTAPCIVLSTASAYKFGHDVLKCITGKDIADDFEAMDTLEQVTGKPVPRQLKELRDLPVRFTRVIDIEEGMHAIAARMQEIANG
ncbi:MAG: threonine synthase [Solobacterium sp.]|nr:threonine synthase [Solobacterium sp.]